MSINIQERFKQMSLGEKIILIAAPLLLIDSFLPWYHISVDLGFGFGSVSANRSGWQSPGAIWSILALLAGVVMFAQIAIARFTTMQMPALPQGLTWPRVHAGLAAVAVICVLLKIVNESGYLGFGFYIGIVLVAALAVGAGLMIQAERQGTISGGGTSSGAPPKSTM